MAPKEPTTQIGLRLPDSLIKRIDAHVARMNAAHPGLEFSRTDAIKSLLTMALDQAEAAKPSRGR